MSRRVSVMIRQRSKAKKILGRCQAQSMVWGSGSKWGGNSALGGENQSLYMYSGIKPHYKAKMKKKRFISTFIVAKRVCPIRSGLPCGEDAWERGGNHLVHRDVSVEVVFNPAGQR
jgi:hypothetical protein